uniref:Uncharacterized protein n=1 Tax=Caenorhabditis japonica TaxID=281687 RepID=A0A8R1ED61_CAEJA
MMCEEELDESSATNPIHLIACVEMKKETVIGKNLFVSLHLYPLDYSNCYQIRIARTSSSESNRPWW